MTWRTLWRAGLVGGTLLALSCGQESKVEGGFEGDARPTFDQENPYEELDKVKWKSWSDDLFARSSSDRPILLDLSGLWCHGCHIYDYHVYGRDNLAQFINDNFVPVRVDADSRPELDVRYNQGGWPSLCVLTPDGDILAGTTYAPDDVEQFLRSALARYEAGGDSLTTVLRAQRQTLARAQPFLVEEGELDAGALAKVLLGIQPIFDREYGGFSPLVEGGPKLALPDVMTHLLDEAAENPSVEPGVVEFVRRSVDAMSEGAVRDHLFGGFFRTVDDRAWSLPHFEKLLDQQAHVVNLYLLAAARWDDPRYLEVAQETVDFVFDFLSNPDDLTFGNCVDPDLGPGDDGSFYTWTVAEVDSVLGPEEAQVVKLYYGIAPRGEIPFRQAENTLMISFPVARAASRLDMDPAAFTAILDRATARMRAYRLNGPQPRIDSRAFAGPNLRLAAALLVAWEAFDEPSYRDRALRLIDFFTVQHFDPAEGIPHVFDGRSVGGPMVFGNQVAAIEACLRAFEVTADEQYLARARRIHKTAHGAYRNEVTGVYWDLPTTATGPGMLGFKYRPLADNVRMAEAVMDLYVASTDVAYRDEAEKILDGFNTSFAAAGLNAIAYSAAVHRLVWELRGGRSGVGT